nr:MAG TPA: hypothetical protein [Caudoviricetes sp.]
MFKTNYSYFNKFYFLFFSYPQNLSNTHHYFILYHLSYLSLLVNEYPY